MFVKMFVKPLWMSCLTWHMHQRLAPMLFKDDDSAAVRAARPSPVAPPAARPRRWPRTPPSTPPAASPCTAWPPCWTTWPRSPPTASSPPPACPDSPRPPLSSGEPSSSSASPTVSGTRSQAASEGRSFPQASALARPKRGKFGLAPSGLFTRIGRGSRCPPPWRPCGAPATGDLAFRSLDATSSKSRCR